MLMAEVYFLVFCLISVVENVKEAQYSETYDLAIKRNIEKTIGSRLYYTQDTFTNPFQQNDFCRSKNAICSSMSNDCKECQCNYYNNSFISYQYGCTDPKRTMVILQDKDEHECSHVYFVNNIQEIEQLVYPKFSPKSCTFIDIKDNNGILYRDCKLMQTLLLDSSTSTFGVLPWSDQHYKLTVSLYDPVTTIYCIMCDSGSCDLGYWNGKIVKLILECKLVDDPVKKCIILKRKGKTTFKGSPFVSKVSTKSPETIREEKNGIDSTTVVIIVIVILVVVAVSIIVLIFIRKKQKQKTHCRDKTRWSRKKDKTNTSDNSQTWNLKQTNCAHLGINEKDVKSENIYNGCDEFVPQQSQERLAENLYYQSSAAVTTPSHPAHQLNVYESTYITREGENAETEENLYHALELPSSSGGSRTSQDNSKTVPHYELTEIVSNYDQGEHGSSGAIKQQQSYKRDNKSNENMADSKSIDKETKFAGGLNPHKLPGQHLGYEEVGSVLGPH